jgi:hypothetical protein
LKAQIESCGRFLRLHGYERRIVLAAAAGLVTTWLGLRLAGFRRWHRALEWIALTTAKPLDTTSAGVVERAREIAGLVAAAARNLPWRMYCLEQSLVVWWLLRRRGIPATLRMGGRKEGERFEAHAWVELEGANLSDSDTEYIHFIPFEGLITSRETQTH